MPTRRSACYCGRPPNAVHGRAGIASLKQLCPLVNGIAKDVRRARGYALQLRKVKLCATGTPADRAHLPRLGVGGLLSLLLALRNSAAHLGGAEESELSPPSSGDSPCRKFKKLCIAV